LQGLLPKSTRSNNATTGLPAWRRAASYRAPSSGRRSCQQQNIPVVSTLKGMRLVGALSRTHVLGLFAETIAVRRKPPA